MYHYAEKKQYISKNKTEDSLIGKWTLGPSQLQKLARKENITKIV